MNRLIIRLLLHACIVLAFFTCSIGASEVRGQGLTLAPCTIPGPTANSLPAGAKFVEVFADQDPSTDDFHFLINGEPFYPHGWMLGRNTDELYNEPQLDLQLGAVLDYFRENGITVVSAGENTVIDYANDCFPNGNCTHDGHYRNAEEFGNTLCEFLNQAYEHGVYVIVRLSLLRVVIADRQEPSYFDNNANMDITRFQRLTDIVRHYADHPAVFAWDLHDEIELKLDEYTAALAPETPAAWLEQAADAVRLGEQLAPGGGEHPIMFTINSNRFLLPAAAGGWGATNDTWDAIQWDAYEFSSTNAMDMVSWYDITSAYSAKFRYGASKAREIYNNGSGSKKATLFMCQGSDIDHGLVTPSNHFFQNVAGIVAGARGNIGFMLDQNAATPCHLVNLHRDFGWLLQPSSTNNPIGQNLAEVIMVGEDVKTNQDLLMLNGAGEIVAGPDGNPDDIIEFTIDGQDSFTAQFDSNNQVQISYDTYRWCNFSDEAGVENTGAIYFSADGGNTWSAPSTLNLDGEVLGPVRDIAFGQNTQGTQVYAASMGSAGLIKSTDGGTTFTRHANFTSGGDNNNDNIFVVEASGDEVLAGKMHNNLTYHKAPGTTNWTSLAQGGANGALGTSALAFGAGGQLIAGKAIEPTIAGSVQSFNGTEFCIDAANTDFVRRGLNFKTTEIWDFEIDLTIGVTYVAAGDGGIYFRESAACDCNTVVDHWEQIGNISCDVSNGMDIMETSFKLKIKPQFSSGGQVENARLFAACLTGLYYSENVFANLSTPQNVTWTKIDAGQIPHSRVWDVAYDNGNNRNRLYVSTSSGVYRSDDGGDNWTLLSTLNVMGNNNVNTEYYAVEVAPDGTVFVGVDENFNSYYSPFVPATTPETDAYVDNANLFDYIVRKHNGTYYIIAVNYFRPTVNVRFNFGNILEDNETIYRATEILPDGQTRHLPLHQAAVNDEGRILGQPASFEFNADFGRYEARIFKFEVFAWGDTKTFPAIVDGEIKGAGVELAQIGEGGNLDLVLMTTTEGPQQDQTMNFEIGWDLSKFQQDVAYQAGPQFSTNYKNAQSLTPTMGSAVVQGVSGPAHGGGIEVVDLDDNGVADFLMMSIETPLNPQIDGMPYQYQVAWNVSGDMSTVNYDANPLAVYEMPFAWLGVDPTGGGIAASEFVEPIPGSDIALFMMREENVPAGDDHFWINRANVQVAGSFLNPGAPMCGSGTQFDGVNWTTDGAGMDISDVELDGVEDVVMMGLDPTTSEARLYFKETGMTGQQNIQCNVTQSWAPYIRIPMCIEGDLLFGGVALADIDFDGDDDIVVATTIRNSSGYDDFCVRFGINGARSNGNDPFAKGQNIPFVEDAGKPGPGGVSSQTDAYFVGPNFPNPFSDLTKLQVRAEENANVQIVVSNILGEELITVFDGNLSSGIHTFDVSASSLVTGQYICRLTVDGSDTGDVLILTVYR